MRGWRGSAYVQKVAARRGGDTLVSLVALPATGVMQSPQKGGILRIAATTIQQLDPYKTAANDETNVIGLVFDPLVIIGKDGFEAKPHLAESWERPDDYTWIFHLRKGVYFQEGNAVFPKGARREVTADDVVYSINRFMNVSTAFTIGEVDEVKALDRYTVQITTPVPNPFLVDDPNRLASVGIVPKEAVEKLGEDGFAMNPIGSGPFILKSFAPDQSVVLERNPDYWLPVYLDGVEFVVIPDPTVQTMALTAGEVDVVPYIFNVDAMATLSRNPRLQMLSRGGSYRGIGFNVTTLRSMSSRCATPSARPWTSMRRSTPWWRPWRARYGQCPPWVPHGYDPSLKEIWKTTRRRPWRSSMRPASGTPTATASWTATASR